MKLLFPYVKIYFIENAFFVYAIQKNKEQIEGSGFHSLAIDETHLVQPWNYTGISATGKINNRNKWSHEHWN